ncbi:uncharacterized protein PAE49_003489 [Odontesthes bonariensis]
MKTYWIKTILVCFIPLTEFWMLFVPAAEVQHVQFGSTVTLVCNISYLYDTTWLKQNPDLPPTVVTCTSLREGQPVQGFRLSPRFSVSLTNRSLALRISGVEEGDLGLYYCVASVNTCVVVGKGTELQVTPAGSARFLLQHWYCVAVGSGLLIMMLAVCITHWKTKQRKKTPTSENYCQRRLQRQDCAPNDSCATDFND